MRGGKAHGVLKDGVMNNPSRNVVVVVVGRLGQATKSWRRAQIQDSNDVFLYALFMYDRIWLMSSLEISYGNYIQGVYDD